MKVKIVSDGLPSGTRVLDAQTGDELKNVRHIRWHVGVNELATAVIEVYTEGSSELQADAVLFDGNIIEYAGLKVSADLFVFLGHAAQEGALFRFVKRTKDGGVAIERVKEAVMQNTVTVRVDAKPLLDLIKRVQEAVVAVRPPDLPCKFAEVIEVTSSQRVTDGVLVLQAEPTEWTKQLLSKFRENQQ